MSDSNLSLAEEGDPLLKDNKWVSRDGFSMGERLARRKVEPRWLELKEQGNAALKANDVRSAISWFTKALQVATSPWSQMRGLQRMTEALPTSAVLRRILETDVIMQHVFSFLPCSPRRNITAECGPVKFRFSLPNLPAAIALSNRATARAKLGDHERSLKDSELATKYCPEFVRAHEKHEAALRKLGATHEADRVKHEISDYKKLCQLMSWSGPALLAAGWIDHFSLQQYERERQRAIIPHLRGCHYVHGSISLIPFQGGQWMFFNMRYNDRGSPRKVDLFSFTAVDNRNEDMLEELPHGKASPKALKHVPQLTCTIIAQLHDEGITVSTLTCGQGLVDQVDLLQRHHPGINVIPAAATRVSQDAGLNSLAALLNGVQL